MILLYILACIFFIIAIVLLIVYFKEENYEDGIFLFIGLVGLGVMFIFAAIYESKYPTPTKRDVLNGKAIYEEILIINKGDTIKTYNIVWKE